MSQEVASPRVQLPCYCMKLSIFTVTLDSCHLYAKCLPNRCLSDVFNWTPCVTPGSCHLYAKCFSHSFLDLLISRAPSAPFFFNSTPFLNLGSCDLYAKCFNHSFLDLLISRAPSAPFFLIELPFLTWALVIYMLSVWTIVSWIFSYQGRLRQPSS